MADFFYFDGAFHHVDGDLPDGAVLVDRLPLEGERWTGAELVFDPSLVLPLVQAQIDSQAEQVRAKFVTPGAGQAMTYMQKQAEAEAYLSDSAAPTPILTEEAEAMGITVAELAAEVHANSVAWRAVGGKIEGARRAAKRAAAGAANAADMWTCAQIDWQSILTNGG